MDPLQVVLQFLKEEGYHETFDTLCKEAEVQYNGSSLRPHILRQNIGQKSNRFVKKFVIAVLNILPMWIIFTNDL